MFCSNWTAADLEERLHTVPGGLEIILDGPQALRRFVVSFKGTQICPPRIEISFRLRDRPESGAFTLECMSWSLAHDLAVNEVAEQLEEIGVAAGALLTLEAVSFVVKNGEHRGRRITYQKPILTIKGAAV